MRIKTYLFSAVIITFAVATIFLAGDSGNSITSLFVFDFVELEGFEFVPPNEVSESSTLKALGGAEIEIGEMVRFNYTTSLAEDIFEEANLQFELKNYTEVFRLTQLISFIKNEKIKYVDFLELTKRKQNNFAAEKIDITYSNILINRSIEAFDKDQLATSQKLLNQANQALDDAKKEKERRKSIAYLGRNFILKYWWQIILVLTILGVASKPLVKKIIRKKLQKKLANLKDEFTKTEDLIKKLQMECFVDKKITTSAYKIKVEKHEKRLAEIKHTIPVLEEQLKGKIKGQEGKNKSEGKSKVKGVLEVKR